MFSIKLPVIEDEGEEMFFKSLALLMFFTASLGYAVEGVGEIKMVYKILRAEEWKIFEETGEFYGSKDDLKDGFIHLSKKEQVQIVLDKYFVDERPIYIVEFADEKMLSELVWEKARSGDIYPHLYNKPLEFSKKSNVQILEN